MLILSQDEDRIINTDTTQVMRTAIDDKYILATINSDCNTGETRNVFLGEYYYKDRCKEIFKDIMKKADVGARVYYMPKE